MGVEVEVAYLPRKEIGIIFNCQCFNSILFNEGEQEVTRI